jgi:hypothetical protein
MLVAGLLVRPVRALMSILNILADRGGLSFAKTVTTIDMRPIAARRLVVRCMFYPAWAPASPAVVGIREPLVPSMPRSH